MELLNFENGDKIIADVYDDWIELKLLILKGKEIVIFDDTKLYLRSLYTNYFLDKKKMELDINLKNANLGIMLNKYYYRIANDMELDKNIFHLNAEDNWIGMGYCSFENNLITTWIYHTEDRFVFKCTPLCEGMFDGDEYDEYDDTFKEFLKDYKEVYKNSFSSHIYREFLNNLKKIVK